MPPTLKMQALMLLLLLQLVLLLLLTLTIARKVSAHTTQELCVRNTTE